MQAFQGRLPLFFGEKPNSNDPGFPLVQRAENGGLDPSWLNLAFLGRPDFQSRGPKNL